MSDLLDEDGAGDLGADLSTAAPTGEPSGGNGSRTWLVVLAVAALALSVLLFRGEGIVAHAVGYGLVCLGVFVPIALWRRHGYRRQNEKGIALPRWLVRLGTTVLVLGLVAAIFHTAFLASDVEPYVSRAIGIR